MKVVDTLYIALGLDNSKLDKGIATAQQKLSTGFKGIVSKVFAPLMAGVSFGALFDSLQKELSQMNRLSKAYHVNIEDMTAWSRAVVESGGSVDALEGTLGTLNQSLTKMAVTGNSRVKPFFEAMGLDAQELAKKPVLNALEEITKAVEGMDKRQSANLLRGMGFDAGTIKLVQSGTKNVKELIARQKELGVYTAKDAEALTKMNKGFREIVAVLKTAVLPLFVKVISVSSKLTQYVVNGVVLMRKNVDMLRGALVLLSIVFSKQLLGAVIKFGNTFLTNPFGMFIAGLTIVLLLLEDLWVYANKGETAFGDIWKQLGTPDDVLEGFKAVGKTIGNVFKFLGKLFNGKGTDNELKFILLLATAFGFLAASIATLATSAFAIPVAIATIVTLVIAFWDEIKQFFSDIASAFESVGKMLIDFFRIGGVLHKGLTEIWNAIGETVDEVIEGIKNKWKEFTDYIENGWKKIKSFFSFGNKKETLPEVEVPEVEGYGKVNAPEVEDFKLPQIEFPSIEAPEIPEVQNFEMPEMPEFEVPEVSAWNSFVSALESGSASVGNFFASASDTANSAWNSVTSKFDEVKSVLGDFADSSISAWNDFKESADNALNMDNSALWENLVSLFEVGSATIDNLLTESANIAKAVWEDFTNNVTNLFNNLVSNFGSGSSSIGSFLSNAANTAKRAWESFITWLEQKWNWLKELLPNFEKIAGGLPRVDSAPRMAMAGAGGSVSNVTTTDNSTHTTTINTHTAEATNAAMAKAEYVSQANSGVWRK